jgi:hypothetical protein
MVFLALVIYLRRLQPPIVSAQLTYTEQGFRAVLVRWSPDGRERFRRHFAADYVFILLYGASGWLWGEGLQASRPAGLLADALALLLPAAAVFDCVENLLHQCFLRAKPGTLPAWLFALAGGAATAKFVTWGGFAGVLLASWQPT